MDENIRLNINISKRVSCIPQYITYSEKKLIKKTSKYIYRLTNEYLKKKQNIKKKYIVEFMRIDYAWDNNNKLKALELNTCGPQGFMFIKESEKINNFNGKSLSPNSEFIKKYVTKRLGKRIFIISSYIKGNLAYEIEKYEVELLEKQIKEAGNECRIINFIKNKNDIIEQIKDYDPSGIFFRGGLDLTKELMFFKKTR